MRNHRRQLAHNRQLLSPNKLLLSIAQILPRLPQFVPLGTQLARAPLKLLGDTHVAAEKRDHIGASNSKETDLNKRAGRKRGNPKSDVVQQRRK